MNRSPLKTHLERYVLFYLFAQAGLTQPLGRMALMTLDFGKFGAFNLEDIIAVFTWVPIFFFLLVPMALATVIKNLGVYRLIGNALFFTGLAGEIAIAALILQNGYFKLFTPAGIAIIILPVLFWICAYAFSAPGELLATVGKKRDSAFNKKLLVTVVLTIGAFPAIEFVLGAAMPAPVEVKYTIYNWVERETPLSLWKAKFVFNYIQIAAIAFIGLVFFYRGVLLKEMRKLISYEAD